MFLVWILVGIFASVGDPTALAVWHWFGHHEFLTILMILFLG